MNYKDEQEVKGWENSSIYCWNIKSYQSQPLIEPWKKRKKGSWWKVFKSKCKTMQSLKWFFHYRLFFSSCFTNTTSSNKMEFNATDEMLEILSHASHFILVISQEWNFMPWWEWKQHAIGHLWHEEVFHEKKYQITNKTKVWIFLSLETIWVIKKFFNKKSQFIELF